MPHAKLQPSAPTSMVRTSSRPASATLNEQVKVRTMISANRISEILSIGSSTRLGLFVTVSNIAVKHLLLLPPAPQRVVEVPHSQPLIELSLGHDVLGGEATRTALVRFELARRCLLVAHGG